MAEFEVLASGYGLIEGPRADAEGGLYFSDVRGGGVFRRAADGRIETVVPKRRGVGGIALHASGGIVVSGRDLCHVREGQSRVLFGAAGATFNDLFTDGAGRIYAGSLRSDPFAARGPRTPGELWRIEAPGRAVPLCGEIALSNGLGFAPDGRELYHSDSVRREVRVHRLSEDGSSILESRVFAAIERGAPDGLAVAEDGRVWVACYGGSCVAVYAPDGALERYLEVPANGVTSLCFGGADRRDLYVVTADQRPEPERGGTIFRTRVATPGLAAPPARL